jgi:4a-hydroxytetrahydrobiopterin dehydratase
VADLARQRCEPCNGGTPSLNRAQSTELAGLLHKRWQLSQDNLSISAEITFRDFSRAMAFLNRVAAIAEEEQHHPDFCLTDWKHVSLTLTTHAIKALSVNDFIIAAKIDGAVSAK